MSHPTAVSTTPPISSFSVVVCLVCLASQISSAVCQKKIWLLTRRGDEKTKNWGKERRKILEAAGNRVAQKFVAFIYASLHRTKSRRERGRTDDNHLGTRQNPAEGLPCDETAVQQGRAARAHFVCGGLGI